MDVDRLPDRLPPWTPAAFLVLAAVSYPILSVLPRPPGYMGGPGGSEDLLLAIPFVIAGIGAALGLVSEPGRARKPSMVAALLVALAPFWVLPLMFGVGKILPESTDATVTLVAAPTVEDANETEVLLVLQGLDPDARELEVLPGRRKAWSSIQKTSHGGHAALSLEGEIMEQSTTSVDPGLEGFSQVDEAKLVHREGNASVQVTLAVFLDTECGHDRNTYLGSVAPGNESRARHLHESREHCGPI